MNKDQILGAALTAGSIVAIAAYGWLVFLAEQWVQELVIRLTGFIAVAGILGIIAWIGYTLATTPPPPSVEEIEKELEEELKEEEKKLKETEEEKGEKKESKESR